MSRSFVLALALLAFCACEPTSRGEGDFQIDLSGRGFTVTRKSDGKALLSSAADADGAYQPVAAGVGRSRIDMQYGSWRFTDKVNLSIGIENVLDRYTETVELVTTRNNGRLYPGGAPYENEGRNLYGRVNIRF